MTDVPSVQSTHADASSEDSVPGQILALFRAGTSFGVDENASAATQVTVDFVDQDWDGLVGMAVERLPLLVVPEQAATTAAMPARVVVAAEGRDVEIAREIVSLLDPDAVSLDVVHITWLSGIASPPIDSAGLDNPNHQELLMYEGARAALIDRVGELRTAGYHVTSHLGVNRSPSAAINDYLRERSAALFVLGLGKHGAGIGRDVLREHGLPLLFVRARG